MLAARGTQDARKEHTGKLCRGKCGCDNGRAADLHGAKWKVMSCFSADVYYKVKQQRRAITEEEQEMVRLSFTEMGYDGSAIEFDRYEEQYPATDAADEIRVGSEPLYLTYG